MATDSGPRLMLAILQLDALSRPFVDELLA